MPRMGRPRSKHKDMPPGMRLVDGRWHWRPTNAAGQLVLARLAPGRKGLAAGAENSNKDAVRKWWAETVLPALAIAVPDELPEHGTCEEIFERYEREVLPALQAVTQDEHRRYLKNLRKAFSTQRYAKNEAQASIGTFLRAMNLTHYLLEQKRLGRPVAGNREVQAMSRMFHIAKARWGLTEYNPCLQVEFNEETPRDVYRTDADFMKVYAKASTLLKAMMDLMQMHGARRGMLLKLNLADVRSDGLLLTLNKKKRGAPTRRQLVKWSPDLRKVIDDWLLERARLRGGGRKIADLDTAPLFINRKGQRVTVTGYNSMWQRAARAAGFKAHEFHGHDVRAKSASDADSEADAQDMLGHMDPRTTRGVYRRKPTEVTPIKRVSKAK